MNTTSVGHSALETELTIAASPASVWTNLTAEINGWWPAEFYAGGSAGRRRFVLEPEPGGRMFEEWEDGGGLLWGTVVSVDPSRRLQVTGCTFPDWGGPTHWYGSWELHDKDGGTILTFSEHAIGRISDNYSAEKEKGWQFLWQALKAYTEGTEPPEWSD